MHGCDARAGAVGTSEHPGNAYPPSRERWLTVLGRCLDTDLRPYVFPHAGGGANAFRRLARGLTFDVEVLAVCLPGRAHRPGGHPVNSLGELIDRLLIAFSGENLTRGVFFGHNLGGRIAYRLCLALADSARAVPWALLVPASAASGGPPPGSNPAMTDAWLADFVRSVDPAATEVIEEPDLRSIFLSVLRADLVLAKDEAIHRTGILSLPVYAIGRREDLQVSVSDL